MKTKHKEHTKKRLYVRNQAKDSKQWESTNLFQCECGSILEKSEKETEVIKK